MPQAMKLSTRRGFKPGTRLSQINVPDELRVKHSTGIDWVDDALGGEGGFTRTATMMVTGASGGGKSTLMRQLASSFVKKGYLPVYNCGEESLVQVKLACERLKLADFMVAEETRMPTFLEFLDQLKKDHPNKIIVPIYDSLQTMDDGKYADGGTTGNTPVRCCEMIIDWTQANMALSVFIGQVTKNGKFAGKNTIKHAVDMHGHIFFDENKKSQFYGSPIFKMEKNRWGCSGKQFLLEISKTGVTSRMRIDNISLDDEPADKEAA